MLDYNEETEQSKAYPSPREQASNGARVSICLFFMRPQ